VAFVSHPNRRRSDLACPCISTDVSPLKRQNGRVVTRGVDPTAITTRDTRRRNSFRRAAGSRRVAFPQLALWLPEAIRW